MNNISWFLYAVDVIDSLGDMISFIAGMTLILFLVTALVAGIAKIVILNYSSLENAGEKSIVLFFSNLLNKKTLFFFIFIFALEGLIPTQKTMYLIMGSEVGEEVVNSETGQRVQDAINKKLDEYLGDES